MKIQDFGLKEKIEDYDIDEVARIVTVHKDRFEFVCNKGTGFAILKPSIYYNNTKETYPTVGDFVIIEYNENGDSRIVKTLERKTSFYRLDKFSKNHRQVVAANFDYICILQSLNSNYNLHRLERYLTLAYESGASLLIILTKSDLVDNVLDYEFEVGCMAIGVDVISVSTKTGAGLDKLKKYFSQGKTFAFLGSSGVGKSTLINTLFGKEILKTSSIREDDDRGRHTTVARQLIMLPNGSMVIDTPGMREMGLVDVTDGIDKTFSDVEQYIGKCKYSNCTHQTEPDCAIIQAIYEGKLSQDRVNSYFKLKKESMYEQNSENYLQKKREKFKQISKINRKNSKK